MIYIAIGILQLSLIEVAFWIGIYHERKKWNGLIDDGILSKHVEKGKKGNPNYNYKNPVFDINNYHNTVTQSEEERLYFEHKYKNTDNYIAVSNKEDKNTGLPQGYYL